MNRKKTTWATTLHPKRSSTIVSTWRGRGKELNFHLPGNIKPSVKPLKMTCSSSKIKSSELSPSLGKYGPTQKSPSQSPSYPSLPALTTACPIATSPVQRNDFPSNSKDKDSDPKHTSLSRKSILEISSSTSPSGKPYKFKTEEKYPATLPLKNQKGPSLKCSNSQSRKGLYKSEKIAPSKLGSKAPSQESSNKNSDGNFTARRET